MIHILVSTERIKDNYLNTIFLVRFSPNFDEVSRKNVIFRKAHQYLWRKNLTTDPTEKPNYSNLTWAFHFKLIKVNFLLHLPIKVYIIKGCIIHCCTYIPTFTTCEFFIVFFLNYFIVNLIIHELMINLIID